MNEMAQVCDAPSTQHHPDWRNPWRTVTVNLSTWDIGSQISTLDISLAKVFDKVYTTRRKVSETLI
jgi:pterin-4a-carbinolamine dehydratase